MKQPGLFDPAPTELDTAKSRAARDEAIDRAEKHAREIWMQLALDIIHRLARADRAFTSDDVWAAGLPKSREPRALGAAMRLAAKRGIIRKTGSWVETRQVLRHSAPIAEWVGVYRI